MSPPRHHRLHSSRLVALLAQWTQAGGAAPAPAPGDVAEQLGQWLSTVDAVTLGRSLHAIEALPADLGRLPDVDALESAFQHTRAELIALASAPPTPPKPLRERADNTRAAAPDPAAEADFAQHAPRYLALQKQMDARLQALRAQVRQALAQGPRALRQLAVLDAVMEQMAAPREQRLWAALPGHLERRFAQLRQTHQERLQALGQDDEPRRWRDGGGWLATFERDLQALLLAEMHVRLEPVTGLLEAARNAKNMTLEAQE
ncbi:MAG: DUF3348 family protein [Acidovorax sp.]|uniref:DUF3348 family protein n=1 Tax=Acidovorax sp. TaxID=1872122 RepID=UPI0039E5554D